MGKKLKLMSLQTLMSQRRMCTDMSSHSNGALLSVIPTVDVEYSLMNDSTFRRRGKTL